MRLLSVFPAEVDTYLEIQESSGESSDYEQTQQEEEAAI